MKISGKTVRASRAPKPRTKRVMAETEVAPEAADLLFEPEDVAELVAEITGEDVTVEADGTAVTFEVGEETFTCEAEEDIEEVESSTRIRGRKPVKASTALRRAPKKAARRR